MIPPKKEWDKDMDVCGDIALGMVGSLIDSYPDSMRFMVCTRGTMICIQAIRTEGAKKRVVKS